MISGIFYFTRPLTLQIRKLVMHKLCRAYYKTIVSTRSLTSSTFSDELAQLIELCWRSTREELKDMESSLHWHWHWHRVSRREEDLSEKLELWTSTRVLLRPTLRAVLFNCSSLAAPRMFALRSRNRDQLIPTHQPSLEAYGWEGSHA